MVLFSAMAPLGAIATFLWLSGSHRHPAVENIPNPQTLGAILLFSAGTFLFVATMHILPEAKHSIQDGDQPLPWRYILLIGVGILLPNCLNLSHSHHH